ncbi:MAG: ATP-dependent DNA helicase [Patescibacteria group bacterium]
MAEDLLSGLNEAQLKAVTHRNGPLLIVAGAGTGKTTVLTRRFIWLLGSKKETQETAKDERSSLTPDNILALTFTEKAAGEMEDRILELMPIGTYDFWISTFHGFCQRILEKYALEIGLPNKFRVLNETDAWLLLRKRLNELPLDYYRPLGNPTKFLNELLKHFSRAKDEGVTSLDYLEFAENAALDGDAEFVTGERARLKELADCYVAYERIMRQEGTMDFGDLILEALRLLRERPRVLKELQEQFKCILVDEFQDTNWAQYELIKLLSGGHRNLTVVGDDDQAIYKFRGASLANILQFRDDFLDVTTVVLTHNYRSHQEILDAAYSFITKNDPNRLEVQLKDQGISKQLKSHQGQGGKVELLWFKTLEEEADAVAGRIKELKDSEPDLSWNDIAVLSRSNDGAAPFVAALERYGIPFRFYALTGLYSEPLILDIISFLKLIDGSMEPSVAWRVISSPCFSFPTSDIAAFLQYSTRKGLLLWEAVKKPRIIPGLDEFAVKRSENLRHHVESLAEAAKRDRPLKILQMCLDRAGILSHVMKFSEREKIENINLLNSFANRIQRYEAVSHGPTLRGFLEDLSEEIESGEDGALHFDPDAGPELVKIMTVHASKGLEFKHVFLVSMVDQRFPTRPRGEAIPLPDGLVNERLTLGNAHLEEERRLFYVALTRAKHSVTATGADHYGGTRKKKPSVFLSETGLEIPKGKENSDQAFILKTPLKTEDREKEFIYFPLKRRFSFTQLAAFDKCPKQYKFAHVYKIPVFGSFQKSFGQTMHLVLHDILARHMERGRAMQADLFSSPETSSFQKDEFRVGLEEALQIFEDRWIDEWYKSREDHDKFKAEGRSAVKSIIEAWQADPPEPKFLERPFEWRLGEHSLKGAIDRIDEVQGGGIAIYDYKTGEPKTSEDMNSSDKHQLWLYQMAMENMGLSVKKLAYIYVRSGKEAEVELLQGDAREKFVEEMKSKMDDILRSSFSPSPSIFVCRYCDFRGICESKKL